MSDFDTKPNDYIINEEMELDKLIAYSQCHEGFKEIELYSEQCLLCPFKSRCDTYQLGF